MMGLADHLTVVPILLPLIAAAVMLLLDERRRTLKSGVGIATTVALLIVSIVLLRQRERVGPVVYVRLDAHGPVTGRQYVFLSVKL